MKKLYKKYIFALIIIALLLLSSCMAEKVTAPAESSSESTLGEWVYTSEWPDNEFTQCIPRPEHGEVWCICSINGRKAFNVSLIEISMDESDEYIEKLKSVGYSLVAHGSNDVSTGVNMVKDDVSLSIAYSGGVLGILIILDAESDTFQ